MSVEKLILRDGELFEMRMEVDGELIQFVISMKCEDDDSITEALI